jgi:hypothetical protein
MCTSVFRTIFIANMNRIPRKTRSLQHPTARERDGMLLPPNYDTHDLLSSVAGSGGMQTTEVRGL